MSNKPTGHKTRTENTIFVCTTNIEVRFLKRQIDTKDGYTFIVLVQEKLSPHDHPGNTAKKLT